MLARDGFVEGGGLQREGVEEKQRRIDPECADLAVAAVEGVAPAQRHRVFQVQCTGATEQTEEHQHAHHRRTADCRQHADALRLRSIQGDALQAQQRPGPQRYARQPGQGDPQHRIGLPEHAGGDLRIAGKAQHRGVEAHAQVGVVAKIDDVQQAQRGHGQQQIAAQQPAHRAETRQTQLRQRQQDADRQHQQQGQAQVEAQADAEGGQHIRLADALNSGKAQQKQSAQGGEEDEQQRSEAGQVMQATGFQPAHANFLVARVSNPRTAALSNTPRL